MTVMREVHDFNTKGYTVRWYLIFFGYKLNIFNLAHRLKNDYVESN